MRPSIIRLSRCRILSIFFQKAWFRSNSAEMALPSSNISRSAPLLCQFFSALALGDYLGNLPEFFTHQGEAIDHVFTAFLVEAVLVVE